MHEGKNIHTGSFKQTQIIAIAQYCYYLQNALQLFIPQVFVPLELYKSAVAPTSLFPAMLPSLQVPVGRKDSPAMDLWSWIPPDWSVLTETLRSVIPGVGTGSLQMQLKDTARPLSVFLYPDSQSRDSVVLQCSVPLDQLLAQLAEGLPCPPACYSSLISSKPLASISTLNDLINLYNRKMMSSLHIGMECFRGPAP